MCETHVSMCPLELNGDKTYSCPSNASSVPLVKKGGDVPRAGRSAVLVARREPILEWVT